MTRDEFDLLTALKVAQLRSEDGKVQAADVWPLGPIGETHAKSHGLRRLEDRGFVKRFAGLKKKDPFKWSLTPKGRRVLDS